MLTGKNRKQFVDWLNTQKNWKDLWYGDIIQLYNLPLSMQFGVVQSYADSIGYIVQVVPYDWEISGNIKLDGTYSFSVHKGEKWICDEVDFETRDEARLAAIKAFDEIVNAE